MTYTNLREFETQIDDDGSVHIKYTDSRREIANIIEGRLNSKKGIMLTETFLTPRLAGELARMLEYYSLTGCLKADP